MRAKAKEKAVLKIVLIITSFVISLGAFAQSDNTRIDVVVIDPGHGGYDPGNLGTRRYPTREKDIALAVSLKLGDYIEQNLPGVKVIYTRDDDTFVELKKRTEIANKANADLFISIHCDAFGNSRVHGTTTFVMGQNHSDENLRVAETENKVIMLEENYEENYEGFDPSKPETYISLVAYQSSFLEQSIEFAVQVQEQFRERVSRRDRGVKQQPLYVTSRTTMPAVLIELGFLTNPGEEDFLNSDQGQSYLASAIFRAFRSYKAKHESFQLVKTEQSGGDELVEDQEPQVPLFFTVQIMASSTEREPSDSLFRALPTVGYLYDGRLFKYYSGQYLKEEEARKAVKEAQEAGFRNSFVIAVNNGERISLEKARSILQ